MHSHLQWIYISQLHSSEVFKYLIKLFDKMLTEDRDEVNLKIKKKIYHKYYLIPISPFHTPESRIARNVSARVSRFLSFPIDLEECGENILRSICIYSQSMREIEVNKKKTTYQKGNLLRSHNNIPRSLLPVIAVIALCDI